jgi:uncharacterized Fe-S cluster-containing radical SAM superfamily protein
MSTMSDTPDGAFQTSGLEPRGAQIDSAGFTPSAETLVRLGEFHTFEAAGERFGYMVPSAAVFAFDACASAIVDVLEGGPRSIGAVARELAPRFDADEVWDTLGELWRARAIAEAKARPPAPKILPLTVIPLQTLVVNVTNQCNLSCEYCYEYGEDKIVDTENGKQPKFMSEETARQAIDFALRESGRTAMVTFFGGETLMNFPVLRKTVAYARARAAEVGKGIDFSLTTNATLLKPDVIDFLADERIGVTISIDGPQEVQDKFRVFHNGKGSYDIVAPKIKALLARHKSRPIGAAMPSATLASTTCLVSSGRWLRTSCRRRSPTGITAFRTCARRCRSFTKGTPRRTPAAPGLDCWVWRPTATCRCATVLPAPRRTVSARSPAAWTGTNSKPSWNRTTSITRPTASPAGRGRSAPAAAITRPTPATARRPGPTCTTVSGFAAGRTRAWRSTASLP